MVNQILRRKRTKRTQTKAPKLSLTELQDKLEHLQARIEHTYTIAAMANAKGDDGNPAAITRLAQRVEVMANRQVKQAQEIIALTEAFTNSQQVKDIEHAKSRETDDLREMVHKLVDILHGQDR